MTNTLITETEKTVAFWKEVYSYTEGQQKTPETIREAFTNNNVGSELTITFTKIQSLVKSTRNRNACGQDTIRNFWLKRVTCSSLHLVQLYLAIFIDPEQPLKCTLQLRTLLILEAAQPKTSKYRPIATMSNVFKVLNKIVLRKIKLELTESCVITRTKEALVTTL